MSAPERKPWTPPQLTLVNGRNERVWIKPSVKRSWWQILVRWLGR